VTRILKNGDILNIDITVIKDGFHGDTSRMFMIGEASVQAKRVIKVCYEAMRIGIEMVKPGARLGDIGHAIQNTPRPRISRWSANTADTASAAISMKNLRCCITARRAPAWKLVAGMTFTIEPMINAGKRDTKLLPDGWTVVTKDHSLSAQWETHHTGHRNRL